VASVYVEYRDGKPAKNVKVSVSVDRGGTADGFTGSDGWAHIQTSGTRGKVFLKGREVHNGLIQRVHVVYPS
jgi:hypothetical protein